MAKKNQTLLGIATWLTGVLVSLAVAFAMTSGTLTIPFVSEIVTVVAGWIVVITTLISAVLAVVNFKL